MNHHHNGLPTRRSRFMATTSCCQPLPRILLAWFVFIAGWSSSVGLAQIFRPKQPVQFPPNARFRQFQPPTGRYGEDPIFATDRDSTQLLSRAREYLETSKYDLALPRLQALLNQDNDTFFQPDAETDANRYVSVKAATRALLAELDADGRQRYELQYGPLAKTLLERALQNGDRAALEESARKYDSTTAGFEAGYRLGQWRLDQGEAAAAAIQLQSLLRYPERANLYEPTLSVMLAAAWAQAGHADESQAAWDRATTHARQGRIQLGGREYAVAELAKIYRDMFTPRSQRLPVRSSSEKQDWLLFRGNASRTAASPPILPTTDVDWKLPALATSSLLGPIPRQLHEIQEHVDYLQTHYRQTGRLSAIPTMHPLVVDDLVIFRTLANLQAVNVSTGKIAWETSRLDRPLLELASDPGVQRRNGGVARSELDSYLTQRLWLDSTFGQISSDGTRVYAIEELGYRGSQFLPDSHPSAATDTNRLVAYDITADGQIAWQVGGRSGQGNLPGHFFLGPPLPLGSELFCLAESGGEISLIVLRADDGSLQWRQTLVQSHRSVAASGVRRFAGISPAREGGVLVCPTAAGAVVALDLSRRMLLWGYQYPQKRSEIAYSREALNFGLQGGRQGILVEDQSDGLADGGDRWIDSTPTIAGRNVLLTPRDSDELHCLDLWDGQVRWTIPRVNSLYVATTTPKEVIVVGQSMVMAYDLQTGDPAWPQPIPIDEPAGRGYRSGDFYHLPLVKGRLATISLPEGRLQAVSSIDDDFQGNLVAVGNRVFCQSVDRIVGFQDQTQRREQINQALHADPNDLESRLRRGRLRLHLGDEAGAVEDFRHVLASNPSETAVEQLADVFIRRLQSDFANHEQDAELLAGLPMSPEQTRRFFLAITNGLLSVGRPADAFRRAIECAQSDTLTLRLETVSGTWSACDHGQLSARMHAAWKQLSNSERNSIRQAVAQIGMNLKTASEAKFWLQLLPREAVSDQFAQRTVKQPEQLSGQSEYAAYLDRLRHSTDPQVVAAATVERLTLLSDSGYIEAARQLVEELEHQFADVRCHEDQTGAEFATAWRNQHSTDDLWTTNKNPWSGRQLNVELSPRGTSATSRRIYPLPWRGQPSAIFSDWSFELSSRRSHLVARDGFGRPRWQLQVHDDGQPVPIYDDSFVAAEGNLLLVSFGSEFIVLDTLTEGKTPQILWRRNQMEDFNEDPKGQVQGGNTQRFSMTRYPGPHRMMHEHTDDEGRPLGGISTPTDSIIVYQAGTFVRAADCYTGEIVWQYRNMPRGCRIYSAKDRIILALPDDDIWILRANDGSQIHTDNPTTADALFAIFGRHGLSWNQTREKSELVCMDLDTGEPLWSNDFGPGAAVSAFSSNEVAVMNRSGEFRILGIEDGQPRFQTSLPEQPRLLMMAVIRSSGRYLILTNQYSPDENASLITRPVIEGERSTYVNGLIASIDRDSKTVQHTPVEMEGATLLTQPKRLPIWVLQRSVLQQQFGPVFNATKFEIQVYDARTTNPIFKDAIKTFNSSSLPSVPNASGEIDLRFLNATIEIRPGDPLKNHTDRQDDSK